MYISVRYIHSSSDFFEIFLLTINNRWAEFQSNIRSFSFSGNPTLIDQKSSKPRLTGQQKAGKQNQKRLNGCEDSLIKTVFMFLISYLKTSGEICYYSYSNEVSIGKLVIPFLRKKGGTCIRIILIRTSYIQMRRVWRGY
jgi:hypothetical protein